MLLIAAGLGVGDVSPVAAAGASVVPDFNGDGVQDVAVADPEATVAGVREAGAVHVVYGGGVGTTEITQEPADIPGGLEVGDRYGYAMATADLNGDGYSDLVVASPYEDIGSSTDAGWVHVIYGAASGLNTGPSVTEYVQGSGGGSIGGYGAETDDWFGYSVAAGETAAGQPYLIIGVPGETKDGFADAGIVHYVREGVNVAIHQETPGVEGVVERDDRFGYAVAASPYHIALGNPGEAVSDTNTFAGGVQILSHELNGSGLPTPIEGITQTTPGVKGGSETGDRFGSSLAVIPYGTSAPGDSIIAVGIPAEDISSGEDAGRVITLRVSGSGLTPLEDIHQSADDVAGVSEDGDYFGQHITAVNRDAATPISASTALLAVGVPGEDTENVADSGSVYICSLSGPPGGNDVVVEPGLFGLPGSADARDYLGTSLTATRDHLYVGMPYGPESDRAVHAVPWVNITEAAAQPVTTWKPGQGGNPTGGVAFGAVAR